MYEKLYKISKTDIFGSKCIVVLYLNIISPVPTFKIFDLIYTVPWINVQLKFTFTASLPSWKKGENCIRLEAETGAEFLPIQSYADVLFKHFTLIADS